MGEGWGDYIACTLNNDTVVGEWVVVQADGIRGFPFNSDFPALLFEGSVFLLKIEQRPGGDACH